MIHKNNELDITIQRRIKNLLNQYLSEKRFLRVQRSYRCVLLWKSKINRLLDIFFRVFKGLILRHSLKTAETSNANACVASRERPHLTILMWKFLPGNNQYLSPENHNVVNSLRESECATFDLYFYDTNYLTEKFPGRDLKFVSHIKKTVPDALILSSYSPQNSKQPHQYTLKYISKTMDIPIISLWWDSVSDYFYKKSFLPMAEIIDLNVFIDSGNTCQNSRYTDRCLHLWAPQDPLLFYNSHEKRIHDVCFLGSTSSYRSVRKQYLRKVKNLEKNYRIIITGGTGSQRLSELEYAAVMQKSKISVNFSHSVQEAHQLKARVFETMLCGALLLESENNEIKRLFIPYEDYVPFKCSEDMIEKIKFYLKNESERSRIANNGYQKANRLYSNKKFWEKVIFQLKTISKKEDLIS